MGLIDWILRLFGTNRVRLRWKLGALRDRLRRRADTAGVQARQLERRPASRALGSLVPEGFPLVTAAALAACVALFLVTVKASKDYLGEGAGDEFAPINGILIRYGATEALLMVRLGEWYRAITAVFLHGDVVHIVMNGLGLWVVGAAVEERFGRARLVVAFLLTGVAGNLLSVWWRWRAQELGVPGVGASGAIFGLIGLMIGHAARVRGRAARELRERFVPWAIYGLILGFASPETDNVAHVGGLLSGLVLGALLADRATARRRPAWLWTAGALAALGATAAAFVQAARFDARIIGM